MPKNSSNINSRKQLQHIVDLLKFVLELDNEEIIKSSIESIIELLEEEILQKN